MRYFSFDFMSFLRFLARIFLPMPRMPAQTRSGPNIRGASGLTPRDKGHANHFPTWGDRSIISPTFFSARRRRLIHDRRLMMV